MSTATKSGPGLMVRTGAAYFGDDEGGQLFGYLPSHLNAFDIFSEQVVDQGREIHPLGAGQRGRRGLHLLLQVHRQTHLRAGAVKLATPGAGEIDLGWRLFIVMVG